MKACSLTTLLLLLFVYRLPYAEAGASHTPNSHSVVITGLLCVGLWMIGAVLVMAFLKGANKEMRRRIFGVQVHRKYCCA